MILVMAKFVHVATIALWAGGLVALPLLYVQRRGLEGEALYGLHAFTRFFYVGIVSPAAFVAIGSGTVLVFLRETFVVWFSIKLALVAAMTGIHIFAGLAILRLFERGHFYPVWRAVAGVVLTVLVVTGILAVVLGKPQFGPLEDLEPFFAPGALQIMANNVFGDLIPW